MKNSCKKIISAALTLGMLAASVQAFAHWGDAALEYAVENNLLNVAALQSPDLTVKRYEMAQAVYAAAGSPDVAVNVDFDDTDAGADYMKAVEWCAKEGIMSGTSETTFEPDAVLTREMAATILFRFAKEQGLENEAEGMAIREFLDYEDISDWAIAGVAFCVQAGLIVGDDEGYFRPQENITYAQLATVLQKTDEKTGTGQAEDPASVNMYIGEVRDASMNGLLIITQDGVEREFVTADAKVVPLGDDGIAIGDYVAVTYAGQLERDTAVLVEEIDQADVNFVTGTVQDATMNTLTITTEDGAERTFDTSLAEVEADEAGIQIGDTVSVTYMGNLERDMAAKVVKVQITDAEEEGGAE